MDEMIRQIRVASDAGLYYLALFGALTLPDICGALASNDGRSSPSKYKAWFRDRLPQYAEDTDLIYGLRCSLVHQGRALPDKSAIPVAFMHPATGQQLHQSRMIFEGRGEIVWYSIPLFVADTTQAAKMWLRQFENTNTVKRNLDKFARVRPEGLDPYVVGAPVIA